MTTDTAAPASGLSLAALAERTGARLDGDGSTIVRRVGTLEHASPDAIVFLANPKYRSQLQTTRAAAVILASHDASSTSLPKLVSANPYATYARVAALLHPDAPVSSGIHPNAIVDDRASIGVDCSIGANAVVAAAATIGAGATIGPGCVIGAEASIGEQAVLHANVVIYSRCSIGARTVVHAGAVIGAEGFGMAEDAGRWVRIPQVGRVVVGDDCEIGANTTIDRGAIDDTVLENDVKLDNQIQIGHNCTIGAHTAIAGCAGIAGSVRIGRNCRIGGAAMIVGHLTIPDGTVISGGTLIAASPDAAGTYTSVFPALPHREWRKVAAQLRNIDMLAARVRELERIVREGKGS